MKEISYCGFMNADFLATIILGESTGILYVFNHGNYGKVRNYFYEIKHSDENDKVKISDWLSNRLRDEEVYVNPSQLTIEIIDKKEVTTTIIHLEEKGSIGDEVIRINFNFLHDL